MPALAAIPHSAEEIRTSPTRWLVLAVMSLGIFLILVDNTIVNTALPAISRDLSASTSTLQWVIDSYTLVLAGLLLLGGTIGDRFGRRQWMAIGMSIFGLAAVGAAFSTNAESLIAFRALQGVGAALVMPATLSILTDVFSRKERALAIGIWTGVGGLGIGMGPAIGGYLVDEFGWAAVFLMHVPIVLLALAGLFFLVPDSKDERERKLDVPGGLLATGGLVALGYGIIQGTEAGWTSGEIIGSFVVAVALLTAFIMVELRTAEPMLPLQLFRQKDFTGGVIIIGLIFFALFVTFFFLTQYFQLVQGRSAFEAGLLIVIPAAGMMVGAPIAGLLVKRIGPRILLLGALTSMAAGLLLFLRLEVDTSTLQIAISLFTFGIGVGSAMAPLTDTVMAAVPVNDAGVGSAANDVSRELGAALGIAIVGSLVNGIYRNNIDESLGGVVPASAVESAKEGIGIAVLGSEGLPVDVAAQVVSAANVAFVDAITVGFAVSIGVLVVAAIAALTLLPNKMRETQVEVDDFGAEDHPRIGTSAPQATPVPVSVDSSAVTVAPPVRQGWFH
ncbi:MAG: MFS transporter [Chloroflexi bacterium]|nr:MFS transporter [Chloroflexota bacterium]MCI0856583.1 MFS transporter [Chloroflexota bacterium]MCI0889599.1 MFS transporter [Chloroflexota bacterium]